MQTEDQRTTRISVQTHNEKSNVILRFSTIGSKIKSKRGNEADSNEFLLKYLNKLNREPIGIWSVLGIPFQERGKQQAVQFEPYRNRKKKRKKKAVQNQQKKATALRWGGAHPQTEESKVSKTENVTSTKHKATSTTKNDLHCEQYSFPKHFIAESEMRLRFSKNGVPFAKIIEEQANKSGALFQTIKIDKSIRTKADSLKQSKHSSRRNSVCNSSNRRSLAAIAERFENAKAAEKTAQFESIRQCLHNGLLEQLAISKMDRLETYQSPKMLGIAMRMASTPKLSEFEHLSSTKSIWSKAKQIESEQNEKENRSENELQIEKSLKFYRNLLCFIERTFGTNEICKKEQTKNKQRGINKETVDFVVWIKEELEDGNAANHTLFHQMCAKCKRTLEAAQNNQILHILEFIRKYFDVSAQEFDAIALTMDCKVSKEAMAVLFGEARC